MDDEIGDSAGTDMEATLLLPIMGPIGGWLGVSSIRRSGLMPL